MKTIITFISMIVLALALGCGGKQAETEKGHEGHDHKNGKHEAPEKGHEGHNHEGSNHSDHK